MRPEDCQLRDCAAEFSPAGCPGMTMGWSLRANGSRECAPDDRLREAIHRAARSDMDCFRAHAPLRKRFAFIEGNDGTVSPSGKSPNSRLALHVKIFRLTQRPNHCLTSARLTADEGRVAIVTNVAVGCDGRGACDRRAQPIRGRRSRVVLMPRRWHQISDDVCASRK
jgi:hypothetical protein